MVVLQQLELQHAANMVEAALESVAEINPWMDWCTEQFEIKTAESFIAQQIRARESDNAYEFALFDCNGGYLGGGGVNTINHEYKMANVGYWIRTSQTQKGYGTKALLALVNWARENTDLNRLEVVVATNNHASNRVAQKSGAVLEGVAKARLYNNGKYMDANMYAFAK